MDEIRVARRNYKNKMDSVTKFCEKVNGLVMHALQMK